MIPRVPKTVAWPATQFDIGPAHMTGHSPPNITTSAEKTTAASGMCTIRSPGECAGPTSTDAAPIIAQPLTLFLLLTAFSNG